MKIVVVDGATLIGNELSWDGLGQYGELIVHQRLAQDQVIDACSDAAIVVTNKVLFDRETLIGLPQLKLISVSATGYNNVDVEVCESQEITVCNVPAYSTDAVAQHVFAMLLATIHQPEGHSASVHNSGWVKAPDFAYWLRPTWELAGKTMGVVGLGQIGSAVAKIACAFGMQVLVSSRSEKDPSAFDFDFTFVDRDELISKSDVISLHCPQTEATRGMINATTLGKMKSTAILINTARGGLVNEADLAQALSEHRIRAACLDVVSQEPMSADNPLLGIPNCLITPHNAWAAIEARRRCLEVTIQNVASFLDGKPQNRVR